jgi:pimeloyl-ACP methyl ester carboxylesterase
VLLVDNRGHGASEGDPNAFGWDHETDVNAALDYLTTRADVDADRIGGLGLSVGGETLLDIPPRPVFLIHAKGENLNPVYYRSAGTTSNWAIWEVPGAKHIGGLDTRPEEYERRVTAFFERALLPRQ